MELINHTSLSSDVTVSVIEEREEGDLRLCTVIAKAGFTVTENGAVQLEDLGPEILMKDESTPLGLLPRDSLARFDDVFELVLLGAAHAPTGHRTTQMRVGLALGEHQRELLVTGDRVWVGSGEDAVISDPVPFKRMPLIWNRAFGGATQVWLDEHSPLPISHSLNALGHGWNPQSNIDALGRTSYASPGYPRSMGERLLPNIEDPAHPVRAWSDEPRPYTWGALPLDLGLRNVAVASALEEGLEESRSTSNTQIANELLLAGAAQTGLGPGNTAHPDWCLESEPDAGTLVELIGCTPDQRWAFGWPSAGVVLDYTLAERTGCLALTPVLAVLLPEQSRLTITYRTAFKFATRHAEMERSLRLRTCGGPRS